MEKHDDLTLMKARSYRSVLKAGFQLYTGNFRRLFKASWQMALVWALSCGALGTLSYITVPEMVVALTQQFMAYQAFALDTLQQYALSLLGIVGLTLLAIVTLGLASATILNKLREHKDTGTVTMPPHWFSASPQLMGRTLKGLSMTLALTLVPLLLLIALMAVAEAVSPQFTLRHLTTVGVTFAVCSVAVALLSLPLMHVLMKYLMEAPCGYFPTLTRHYVRGLRHWGALFLVFFVSLLLVQLAELVVMLPSNILTMANLQAQTGLLIGDPLGMPGYMKALSFLTFTLCSFIMFYISQVTLVHNYYAYGAIETQEAEQNSELNGFNE